MSNQSTEQPQTPAAQGPTKVPDKVYLTILVGQEKATHVIEKARITLGLQAPNDVVLSAEGISNFHAELSKTAEGWQLKDLGSTNGTYVNGQRITMKALTNKDKIIIGRVLLRFNDAKPIPPTKKILYSAVGATLLAFLGYLFGQDLLGSGTGPVVTKQEQETIYLSMMEAGLSQFEQKDFDKARMTFQAARTKFSDKNAPNNMLRLTEIFRDNPSPASFPWDKVKNTLGDLEKETPPSEAYKAFVAREKGLIDKDRQAAEHIKIIFAQEATPEDKFRVLNEAGIRWPESRVYKLFSAQLTPIAAALVKKYMDQGDVDAKEATDRIAEEKWQESGDAFLRAKDNYKKAQDFDVNKMNREIGEKLRKTEENIEAFGQFLDGFNKAVGGQTKESSESYNLVRFGAAYYTGAQAQIQGLRLEGQLGGITERYLAGEISLALERIRKLKNEAKDNKNLVNKLIRIESKYSRIERCWLTLQQAVDAKDYRVVIEQYQMIYDLERDDRAGNWYINEGARAKNDAENSIKTEYQAAVDKLNDALKNSRYIDVKDLADSAKKLQLDPSSTEIDRLIAEKMKPVARDVVDGLNKMKLTGADPTDIKFKNMKFGAQLVIDFLASDSEVKDTVEKAKKLLGQN